MQTGGLVRILKGVCDMKQLICPLDGKLCEAGCPDRYRDQPQGGCMLTTAQEQGARIIDFGDGDVGMMFLPGGGADK